jgi:hypothetical protein
MKPKNFEQRSYSSLVFAVVVDSTDDRGGNDHDTGQGDSSRIDTGFYVEAPGLEYRPPTPTNLRFLCKKSSLFINLTINTVV